MVVYSKIMQEVINSITMVPLLTTSGGNQFNNYGTFYLQLGSIEAHFFNIPLNNYGYMELVSGVMVMNGWSSSNTSINVTSPASVYLNGVFSGQIYGSGAIIIASRTVIAQQNLTITDCYINMADGSANLQCPDELTLYGTSSLHHYAGTISGPGPINFTPTSTWIIDYNNECNGDCRDSRHPSFTNGIVLNVWGIAHRYQ
jgi:hypothetical protein